MIHASFVRDKNTGAVVNIDDHEYDALVVRRKEKKLLLKMQQDINVLKQELNTIKMLLKIGKE